MFEGGLINNGLEFCLSRYGFPVKSLKGNNKSAPDESALGGTIFCAIATTGSRSNDANKLAIRLLDKKKCIIFLFKVFFFSLKF
jgi:hypothetical protein